MLEVRWLVLAGCEHTGYVAQIDLSQIKCNLNVKPHWGFSFSYSTVINRIISY